MDNRAIGIFDSGLGGLTALSAFHSLLPQENIIYFADSARIPYGGRAREQLRMMTGQDLDFLASFGVKAIIAACGTASSTAPDVLDGYRLPVFGVLRAAVRVMSAIPGDAPLGVIATEASIRAGSFKQAISALCPGREILAIACPDFVPLIESGHVSPEDSELNASIETTLRPLKEAGVSALLLGCTHYGLISEAISGFLGKTVQLVSASECAAKELQDYVISSGLEGGEGKVRFFTSGSAESFVRSAAPLLGGIQIQAEHVPAMEVNTLC